MVCMYKTWTKLERQLQHISMAEEIKDIIDVPWWINCWFVLQEGQHSWFHIVRIYHN